MLDQLRTHLAQELRIPEVLGERCVHALIETASCRACVTSCHKQAWILSDESLGINVAACDGCGLCASVCPEGAILHSHEPLLRQLEHRVAAFAACERSELTGEGVMPCIHALGVHDILKLYRQGVREFILAFGNCLQCDRHAANRSLQQALITINHLLAQREHALIVHQELSPTVWQNQRQQAKAPVSQENLSRRNFLRRGLQTAITEGLKWKGLLIQDREHFPPLATLLPTSTLVAELPYIPKIDASRCDGCHACFNLCPHEVLFLDIDVPQYLIMAERCTGCRICVDVCRQQAISIEHAIIPQFTSVPVTHTRCRACGAPFYRPTAYVVKQPLCHICSKVNHHRNLFQVMT
jgi:ferredoxin